MDKNTEKIGIKNISNSTISLYVPEINLNRELPSGRTINIDKELYEDLTFNQGFNNLVEMHYLQIIGLEDTDKVTESKNVFTKEDINKMLNTLDITSFAKFIPNAMPAEKDTVIELAVEKGITNSAFVQLIKKYCGKDIITLINTKHQEED